MSTENAIRGLRDAIEYATGNGDPKRYINREQLPTGPDRRTAVDTLAKALLAAHAAAPGYWADETFSDPIWPVITEAAQLFERSFGGKVNPEDGSYTWC